MLEELEGVNSLVRLFAEGGFRIGKKWLVERREGSEAGRELHGHTYIFVSYDVASKRLVREREKEREKKKGGRGRMKYRGRVIGAGRNYGDGERRHATARKRGGSVRSDLLVKATADNRY